jgi:hypothetical protein
MSEKPYDVGYGKPPRRSQFKRGQSGNPSGKRRGVRSLRLDLVQELSEEVRVSENGKIRQLTKQQLVIKALVTKAAKGDTRAIAKCLDITLQLVGIAPDEGDSGTPLSADDAAVMAAAIARAIRNKGGPDGGD